MAIRQLSRIFSVLAKRNYGETQSGRDWIARIIFSRRSSFEPGSD
jgi:hypothetical protein